ncbi:hypothetical protein AAVH_32099, partial [Aphelenchoides avenae]
MLNEIFVEALRFLNRDALDNVEIATKCFNSLVTVHFNNYPQRWVRRFTVNMDGVITFET